MKNPRDLDELHKTVCSQYREFRKNGGRATSPYLHFYLNTKAGMKRHRDAGAEVSPTAVVLRNDGTRGTVDLNELFQGMGYDAI